MYGYENEELEARPYSTFFPTPGIQRISTCDWTWKTWSSSRLGRHEQALGEGICSVPSPGVSEHRCSLYPNTPSKANMPRNIRLKNWNRYDLGLDPVCYVSLLDKSRWEKDWNSSSFRYPTSMNFWECRLCRQSLELHSLKKKKDFIYSWDTQREKQRRKQREKQAPCREPHVGLDRRTVRSCSSSPAEPPRRP